MDPLREFLESVRRHHTARGNFRGLLHVLVGRRVTKTDGTPVSSGMTWRALAAVLKKVRWDRHSASELGIDLSGLPPRDRERYWYALISRAAIDSADARSAADLLIVPCKNLGYEIGPAPGQ